jgi:osmoprotectant transport system permease protein
MGMSGWQRFRRVELPLALPLVVSGVRLALVQVWATATIAALVAGPGLGQIITDGFFRSNYGKGIAGALVVAAVALVLELLAATVQRAVDTTRRGTPAGGHTDALSVTGATVEPPAESVG